MIPGEALVTALSALLDPINFGLLLLAVVVGFVFGMLPGLGGTVLLALLIPLTFGLEPLVAFMLLAAANAGTEQGGAITAILLNVPGKAPNAATILDGYPMAQQGRADEAIGASATASAVGAVFGLLVLLAAIPVVLWLVLQFGPPEIFWLGVWGLTTVAVVVKGRVLTGLLSGTLGLLFAMHGVHATTAATRWTYGFGFMLDGFQLVPALIGLFAVAEMMALVTRGRVGAGLAGSTGGADEPEAGRVAGARSVLRHRWLTLRSSIVGVVVGAIPGVGGTAANYLSYFQAVRTSRDADRFGTGDVRGVIASEASNDAKEGGAYVPTLGFGVPGSASMAVLFGAFQLHGLSPGPLLLQDHLEVVVVIVLAALISNVVASLLGFGLAHRLSGLTRVDVYTLAPLVIALSFVATYAIHNDPTNLVVTAVFALIGFACIQLDVSRVPMILGLVLGPIVEAEFFRSLQLSNGDYGIFLGSELAIGLALVTVLSLLSPLLKPWLRRSGVLP